MHYILFMMRHKKQKGFTLIEVIIYIALFSLLMGSAFLIAYQLFEGSGKLSVKNTVQEEGNFVMRKFNWLMTGAKTFSISGSGSELTVTKFDTRIIKIKLGSCADAGKILMNDTGSFAPITTDNIEVTDLQFNQVGIDPLGVSMLAKIKTINTSPLDFSMTKYIRK